MKYLAIQLFISMRPKHWVKNFFIFIPLIFSKKIMHYPENIETLFSFVVFCLLASGIYIFNDIIDRDSDSRIVSKRNRPIAAGKIKIKYAAAFSLMLCIGSLGLALSINVFTFLLCLIYMLTNIVYSKLLKNIAVIDVVFIGLYFMLRVIVGSVACRETPSHWILIMTFLLAMFLGFTKRRQSAVSFLLMNKNSAPHIIREKKRLIHFLDQLILSLIPSIGIIYMLYAVDPHTVIKFKTDAMLYNSPLVFFGLYRYLYLIHNDTLDEDPVIALLKDGPLKISVLVFVILIILISNLQYLT